MRNHGRFANVVHNNRAVRGAGCSGFRPTRVLQARAAVSLSQASAAVSQARAAVAAAVAVAVTVTVQWQWQRTLKPS